MKIRKPKIKITSKGLKVKKPSARIGGKAGVNISSKGVSASLRTKQGTISSKKGRSTLGKRKSCSKKGCGLTILPLVIFILVFTISRV